MSLTKSLNQVITNTIKQYIEVISSKYDLDQSKLLSDWQKHQSESPKNVTKSVTKESPKNVTKNVTKSETKSETKEISHEPLDPVYILQCKKPELKALCKQRGLPCTGTKAVLIGHLQGKVPEKKAKDASKTKAKSKAKSKNEPKSVTKLKANIPVIAIRKNQFGHHEHAETGFVFDTKLKKVIGTQQKDGNVKELTKDDINICNKFKFLYVLPTNLDSGLTLDDEVVEELDEELEEEVIEEEEEVIEEEEELSDEEIIEEEDEELEDEEY